MVVIVIGISWYLRWNISWLPFFFAIVRFAFFSVIYFPIAPMWWQYQSLVQFSNNVASGCDSVSLLFTLVFFFFFCVCFRAFFPSVIVRPVHNVFSHSYDDESVFTRWHILVCLKIVYIRQYRIFYTYILCINWSSIETTIEAETFCWMNIGETHSLLYLIKGIEIYAKLGFGYV